MRVVLNLPNDPEVIEAALGGLTAANAVLIRKLGLPPLYATGVRYRRERGSEIWQVATDVMRRGEGDCEDLAAIRAAETGGRVAIIDGGRPRLLHAIVERADGAIEDPSTVLGMRAP